MHSVHYENDLPHEFPQYKEVMHQLKMRDTHFKRLWDEYDVLGKEIHRIENEVETPEDAYVEQCKKKRLKLKDEISVILHKAAA